jgi:hypothetical protein
VDWIFWAIAAAGALHIVEEHAWPGGFLQALQRVNPWLAPGATAGFAVVINSLFMLLCVVCALVGSSWLVFTLSAASLVFWNALLHVGSTIKLRHYMPGTVTALVLYVPLALFAYLAFYGAGRVTADEVLLSALLGLAWNLVPVGYLALRRLARVAPR